MKREDILESQFKEAATYHSASVGGLRGRHEPHTVRALGDLQNGGAIANSFSDVHNMARMSVRTTTNLRTPSREAKSLG